MSDASNILAQGEGDAGDSNGAPAGPAQAPGAGADGAADTGAADASGSNKATNEPWYGTVTDPELKGWLDNKGFEDPATAMKAFRNTEKMLGKRRLAVPKDSDDADGWNAVYDALGRPAKPEEYGIDTPEGGSKEMVDGFAGKAHELGLNTQQARELAGWYNGQTAELQQQMEVEAKNRFEADEQELRKEWGSKYDEKIALGQRAVREFGIEKATLEKLEASIGAAELFRLFGTIGGKLGEASFHDDGKGGEFGQTKEGARVAIDQKMSDPAFRKRYYGGDKAAKAEMDKLHKVAYSG